MFSTAGLARISACRPWFVVIAWMVLIVFASVAAMGFGDGFTSEGNVTGRLESVRADQDAAVTAD